MASSKQFKGWTQNLGRDGWDQPMAIPDNMSAESMNIELREGGLGRKRNGSELITFSGVAAGGMFALGKFFPNNDAAAAELWGHLADTGAGTMLVRVPAGTGSTASVKTGLVLPIKYAQLNGKFFIAPKLVGTNRLYVYAPAESTTTIRFAGLKPEAAPTVADGGGVGTYPAIVRSYRVVVKRLVAGVVVSQSEPSTSVSFTPDGAHVNATVTKGAATGEGETHWQVQAASDDGIYWAISGNIVVATTTYVDTALPSTYAATGTVTPPLGSNYPPPAAKFLLSDGIHLFMLGCWATAQGDSVPPVNGRMFFTPAIGTSNMGDDERVVNTELSSGWIDLAIGGGGVDRGLAGPINNSIAAFQAVGVYLFIPTQNADTPYRRVVLSNTVGNISGAAAVMGEDETGQQALYFLDPVGGPYRVSNGYSIQWLGKDIRDLWALVDQSTADPESAFCGTYDQFRKLIIWKCTAVGGATFLIVYDVTNGQVVNADEVRRGWTRWTEMGGASCTSMIMFASALTTPRPVSQVVHYGFPTTSVIALYRQTMTPGTDTGAGGVASVPYQAYVTSKAWWWGPLGRMKRITDMVIVAAAQAATTLRVTLTANWGKAAQTHAFSIAPAGTELYVRPRPNPVDMTSLTVLQLTIGDETTLAGPSVFDLMAAEMEIEVLPENRG